VESLRERLAHEPASALYTSPLRRAMDTALAAPPQLRQDLRLLNSLAEIHCGSVEGTPIDEIRQFYPELWTRNEAQQDEEFRWPGGETYRRFRRRVLRAIRAIAARHAGQRVLLFTHAGVVNQVLGVIAGQSAARWENLRPGNTALTEVVWEGTSGSVARFDDRLHLNDLS
jgi:alpha-ribazole phosphatase/probable phosphoglycerate mutase